jgi:hypothetical protein
MGQPEGNCTSHSSAVAAPANEFAPSQCTMSAFADSESAIETFSLCLQGHVAFLLPRNFSRQCGRHC